MFIIGSMFVSILAVLQAVYANLYLLKNLVFKDIYDMCYNVSILFLYMQTCYKTQNLTQLHTGTIFIKRSPSDKS